MILDKAKATIKKYNLINRNDKIVIGVSGGPDSVALLYLLNSLKREFKLKLHIAHLDHMLRKDSGKDKEFVLALAKRLKLPVTTAQINVKALATHGSIEEIARNARLGFLFKAAKDIGAKKIALGHNLDDRAETVLMRLLRGAGLSGLSAISPKKDIAAYRIIRPLIEIRRKDIELFLKKKKIKARIDISNSQDIYLRNKIRNKLLPLLEKNYNPNIKEILNNTAETVGFDYDYLSQRANKFIAKTSTKIDLKKYLLLHTAIQRLVLRLMIAKLKGDTRRIDLAHIKELEDLILNRPVNSIVDLPKGVFVVKKKNTLQFYRR